MNLTHSNFSEINKIDLNGQVGLFNQRKSLQGSSEVANSNAINAPSPDFMGNKQKAAFLNSPYIAQSESS